MSEPKMSEPFSLRQTEVDEIEAGGTNTSAPAATGNSERSREHQKFLFDCDQLIDLCSSIQKLEILDHSDTILEVRLQDLDRVYDRTNSSYETLFLSSASANARDYRTQGKVKVTFDGNV